MFIETDTIVLAGLFGYARSMSSIRNLGLIDVDVTGTELAAGLVEFNSGEIRASYATGRVSGGEGRAGGLVGFNQSTGKIDASYATGHVLGEDDVGGLVGFNEADVTASYWDTSTSGHTTGSFGEGKTTLELQAPTGSSGIYQSWNLDLDSDQVNDWHLGTATQYLVLSVDFGGNGVATWQEFGYQLREIPTLTATAEPTRVVLTWTPVTASHWGQAPSITYALTRDDGATSETLGEDLSVGIEFSFSVGSAVARQMEVELRQILDDLGLADRVRVEKTEFGP